MAAAVTAVAVLYYYWLVDPVGSDLVLVLGVCSPVRLVAVLAWQGFLAMLAGVLDPHVRRELLGLPPALLLFLPSLVVFLLLAGSLLLV